MEWKRHTASCIYGYIRTWVKMKKRLNKLLFGVGSKQNKGKDSRSLSIQLNSGAQVYGAQQKGQRVVEENGRTEQR